MKRKTSYREIKEQELHKRLEELFKIESFLLGKINYGGLIVFAVVEFVDLKSLENEWNKFNSFLSVEISSKYTNEYTKWNIYIFFVSNDEIPNETKYEIENNKFGSRKIVVDKVKDEAGKELIQTLISNYITNDNIIRNKEVIVKKPDFNQTILESLKKFEFPEKKRDRGGFYSKVLDQIEDTI